MCRRRSNTGNISARFVRLDGAFAPPPGDEEDVRYRVTWIDPWTGAAIAEGPGRPSNPVVLTPEELNVEMWNGRMSLVAPPELGEPTPCNVFVIVEKL